MVHKLEQPTTGRSAKNSCIVVIYGPELGRKYNIQDRDLTIGRSMKSDVCIAQDSISRIHAMIVRDDDRVVLRDNESTNGTYVNDQRIQTAFLRDGDLIKIGRSIFKFLAGDNVESAYHEEIYRLTTVDGLTQIFNKRYFSETLKRELARARRYSRPLALLMFDIDHFKRHNDTHGHRAGDHVLHRLAQLVRKRSRRVDIPARYGGEEFAIILPEIGLSQAASFAETLRRMVEEASFVFEGRDISVTISIGVAAIEPEVTTADEFVQLADSRLYRAKQAGRNRVVSS
ncbi:MAG: GGDEF domain-containing protein [Myxococcota bacterium]